MTMAVEVDAEPGPAVLAFRGETVGETPKEIAIRTFEDLRAIEARRGDLGVVERRVRILGPDRARLTFRFGPDRLSPVARRLGLSRVLVFEYGEAVSFDLNSAALRPEATPVLARQAEILSRYFPGVPVNVCGHTDSTGGDDLNDRLSLERAESVRGALAKLGVAADRMRAHGFGSELPVATNATSEGRALNRRTEIILPD
jgi:outer membrane protein OmpA-like peptidoglycan-associated protein